MASVEQIEGMEAIFRERPFIKKAWADLCGYECEDDRIYGWPDDFKWFYRGVLLGDEIYTRKDSAVQQTTNGLAAPVVSPPSTQTPCPVCNGQGTAKTVEGDYDMCYACDGSGKELHHA